MKSITKLAVLVAVALSGICPIAFASERPTQPDNADHVEGGSLRSAFQRDVISCIAAARRHISEGENRYADIQIGDSPVFGESSLELAERLLRDRSVSARQGEFGDLAIVLRFGEGAPISLEEKRTIEALAGGSQHARRALAMTAPDKLMDRASIAVAFRSYKTGEQVRSAQARLSTLPGFDALLETARLCDEEPSGKVALAEAARLGLLNPQSLGEGVPFDAIYFSLLRTARDQGAASASFLLALQKARESRKVAMPPAARVLMWEAVQAGMAEAELELLIDAVQTIETLDRHGSELVSLANQFRALGMADASYLLGYVHLYGIGVEQDLDRSAEYLSEAVVLDSNRAVQLLRDWADEQG